MSAGTKLIPTGSQTVGPFFRIGLEHLIDSASSPEAAAENTITIRGRMLDRDGAAVCDAMLEFWCASGCEGNSSQAALSSGFAPGFARAATDDDGNFCVRMNRPSSIAASDGAVQAPHMLVLVFARGLLRHLITRVYFDGELGNDGDPVLCTVPAERRQTLIARRDGADSFCWNVILQGADETVFFAW